MQLRLGTTKACAVVAAVAAAAAAATNTRRRSEVERRGGCASGRGLFLVSMTDGLAAAAGRVTLLCFVHSMNKKWWVRNPGCLVLPSKQVRSNEETTAMVTDERYLYHHTWSDDALIRGLKQFKNTRRRATTHKQGVRKSTLCACQAHFRWHLLPGLYGVVQARSLVNKAFIQRHLTSNPRRGSDKRTSGGDLRGAVRHGLWGSRAWL
jgi:hypothetical protein